MKNIAKRLCFLAMAVVLVLSLSATAFAADRTVTFTGAAESGKFDFAPGSKYTSSDLFDNFKNVMPGDRLNQNVRIINRAGNCDYIKVYLQVKPHGDDNAPEYKGESWSRMKEFLSKLTMRIYNGDEPIFTGSADQGSEKVFLGVVDKEGQINLRVELDVPNLDNEFANRVGEVDWVFLAEAFEYKKLTVKKVWDDNNDKEDKRPSHIHVTLYNGKEEVETVKLNAQNKWTYTWDELDGEGQWRVEETGVPKGYTSTSKTKGDVVTITNSIKLIQTGQLNWPIPVLGSLGVLMIFWGMIILRKKENSDA